MSQRSAASAWGMFVFLPSFATGAGAWSYDATGYKLVFPIPQSVLELNTKLSQNPGY